MKIRNVCLLVAAFIMPAQIFADTITHFDTGDLVVSVEGNGFTNSGNYLDNQAAPLSLFEYFTTGTTGASFVGSLVLPQTASGLNFAVSGEYGSSSEGGLQLSGNKQYLTIMGYGVNAATFNANPASFGTAVAANGALAQSGSLTGQSYTPVARVVALIPNSGYVDSSTAIYNVFNTNNPRSAYTLTGASGSNVYVSGQGTGSGADPTGGVFMTEIDTIDSSPTPITGLDTSNKSLSQDTRDVQIYNGQLYVSTDTKGGSNNARSFVGTLGSGTPTSLANNSNGPTMLPGFGTSSGNGKVTLAGGDGNGISTDGQEINLSPEDYFFANSTTLYVADSGDGKQTSAATHLGDGGLQKWSFDGTKWNLDYTLSAGLGLVANTNAHGTSGLLGLTGRVVGGNVELFATNYVLSDLDQTYLFGISDSLANTTVAGASSETFTTLATAPTDSSFKGVSFAPDAPEPATFVLIGFGLSAVAFLRRRAKA